MLVIEQFAVVDGKIGLAPEATAAADQGLKSAQALLVDRADILDSIKALAQRRGHGLSQRFAGESATGSAS
jgi:hypothetical protein